MIYCVSDAHADMVVVELKKAFEARYGSVDDDAVIKITGTADKPLALIRRYKNERNPNVAVTVDLLTTGIDVPEICNLVFLRRVNSRILFEQMLGRATRLCDSVGKEYFRVFDAVRMYEAIQGLTTMQPVVTDPKISFAQLATEMTTAQTEDARALAREQFIAKLQRKKRSLGENDARDFETRAGQSPDDFVNQLRQLPKDKIANWFVQYGGLGEILDRKAENRGRPMLLSEHADTLYSVERGYGQADKPEDYLQVFGAFVQAQSDQIAALKLVLTRPRELTRKQLRELALVLDEHGFSEAILKTAWRETTNQDIAASIMGFIRKAAMNETLLPYEQRVDMALQAVQRGHYFTKPQLDWLKRIAAQTKANQIVDREALDDPNQIFKRDGGGFARLDKMFDGQLAAVLAQFNEAIWGNVAG